MAFTATPQQSETLRRAVDSYCLDYDITDEGERLYIAGLVVALCDLGLLDPEPRTP